MTKKEQIVDLIKSNIANGKYKEGSRLLSETMMSKYFHVSRTTIRDAFDILTEENLIERRVGDGTYVKEKKNKKYIIISTNEAYFIKNNGMYFRRLIEALEKKIESIGYISFLYLEKDSPTFQYGNTEFEYNILDSINIDTNKIAGLVSIMGNEESYKILEKYKIPIIILNKSQGLHYPSVNRDYCFFYNTIISILGNCNNALVFHYQYYDNFLITSESLLHYSMDKYFEENYNYCSIPFSVNTKEITHSIEKHIKKLDKIPEYIVFLDDTLYNNSISLFHKYDNIFKNTKIITHSNKDEIYNPQYKICRLENNIEEYVNTGIELLQKLIKNDFPIQTSYFVQCKIINRDFK